MSHRRIACLAIKMVSGGVEVGLEEFPIPFFSSATLSTILENLFLLYEALEAVPLTLNLLNETYIYMNNGT